MPIYDYVCEGCDYELNDIEQSIKDKPLKKCPECGKLKLERVIYGGCHVSVRNTTTIGQLADKNFKKFKSLDNEKQAKKKEERNASPVPWHKGEANRSEINKMTQQQKQRYIMEGKK